MKVTVSINKSVQENAAVYFERAKKAKRKLKSARLVLEDFKDKLDDALKKAEVEEKQIEEKRILKERKKQWFEKFRWFITSDDFLAVGGRDATTNEIVVKKHADKEDLVFHTEAPGSPFFVIKSEGRPISETAINETAIASASFSRAWKLGVSSLDVFYIKPDQLSKEAPSGEYVGKGAFMIYGKKNIFNVKCEIAIGITPENAIMAGPESAIKVHCEKYLKLKQGSGKTSEIAKRIQKKLGGDLDEIIRSIPEGSELA